VKKYGKFAYIGIRLYGILRPAAENPIYANSTVLMFAKAAILTSILLKYVTFSYLIIPYKPKL